MFGFTKKEAEPKSGHALPVGLEIPKGHLGCTG